VNPHRGEEVRNDRGGSDETVALDEQGEDMSDDETRKEDLLDQVADVHEHFVDLMNERLTEVTTGELELYLGALGKLVGKLEQRDKGLREAAQEMFAEAAAMLMSGFTPR